MQASEGKRMSEHTENNQQAIVLALVVIAVLMAAIVGVLIYQQSKAASIPAPVDASASQTQPPAGIGGATGAPAGGGTEAKFDAKTAPKVPQGTEPEAYVRNYYELCDKGKYDEAYKMLPTATQAYYGDASKFKSTLEGYGITGFDVKKSTATDKEVKVVGTQKAQGMEFAYTWTLVKQGSDWLVKSRDMGAQ